MEFNRREVSRALSVKHMVLNNPRYTDKEKTAWIGAIDGLLETQNTAYENARMALNAAFKEVK